MLPYLAPGEQGALWDPSLRGAIAGLSLDAGPGHLARGLLTGIVIESKRCIDTLGQAQVERPAAGRRRIQPRSPVPRPIWPTPAVGPIHAPCRARYRLLRRGRGPPGRGRHRRTDRPSGTTRRATTSQPTAQGGLGEAEPTPRPRPDCPHNGHVNRGVRVTTLMQQEMDEQPEVLARLAARFESNKAAVARLVPERLSSVVFIGRGSSDNAATLGRYAAELATGRPASLAAPSLTTRYLSPRNCDGVLAIALSQSGRTPEISATLGAMGVAGRTDNRDNQRSLQPARRRGRPGPAARRGPELAVPGDENRHRTVVDGALRNRSARTATHRPERP